MTAEKLNNCADCELELMDYETAENADGERVCDDCRMEYHHCDVCEEVHHMDNMNWSEETEQTYCEDCFQANHTRCDHCRDYAHDSTIIRDSSNTELCQTCYEDHYCMCYQCDDIIRHEDAVTTDYETYCEECKPMTAIRGYSYQFDLNFHGNDTDGLYLGREIEINDGGCSERNAFEILNILNQGQGNNELNAVIKEDCSVSEGFEIVFQPMTFMHINNKYLNTLQTALERLKQLGYTNRGAGHHIHLSRKGFEGYTHITKFVYIANKFRNELTELSRRELSDLERWAEFPYIRRTASLDDMMSEYDNSRYCAVNLENSSTVEVRIFKTSLDISDIKADTQLVYLMHQVSKNNSIEDLETMTFKEFIKQIPRHMTENYKDLLKAVRKIG